MDAEYILVFGLMVGLTFAIFRASPIVGIIFLIVMLIVLCLCIYAFRKKELKELKGVIATNLSISQEEILFDVGRLKKSLWGWKKLYVFTSKGEFEVKVHRNEGEWSGVELIPISNVDYMKELNY